MSLHTELNFGWINKIPIQLTLGIDVDFFALFSLIKEKYDICYFFESLSHPRHQDRYHVIGFDPVAVFSARGSSLEILSEPETLRKIANVENADRHIIQNINPYDLLKRNFPHNFAGRTHQGGLIGYFCHESVNYFEPSLNLKESQDFETFKLGLYLDGLIYDTLTNTLYYYTFGKDRSDTVRSFLNEIETHKIPEKPESIKFLGHSTTRDEYLEAVQLTRQKIIEGYSFQSEVGFKSRFEIKGDKLAIYNKLRQINPSPYMYYLKFNEQELLGASPEILVANKNGVAVTTPAAGTIIRGKDHEEDTRFARQLLNDPKEIAEHNMLVDLHRNDLARVSRPGSVRIQDLMYIIKFSHVQHIASLITAEMKSEYNSFDLLASILPGGVTTGAPKIETVKIIDATENEPRGPYGGAVGRFSFNGDCDFCLPIRSLFCVGDECYAQTSAGIVYDSVPEKEYDEVVNKLAAMKQVLVELEVHFEDRE